MTNSTLQPLHTDEVIRASEQIMALMRAHHDKMVDRETALKARWDRAKAEGTRAQQQIALGRLMEVQRWLREFDEMVWRGAPR